MWAKSTMTSIAKLARRASTVTRSKRPGTAPTAARPATIASMPIPIASAVVAAARAFITLNAPPSGTVTRSPRQVKATADAVTSTSDDVVDAERHHLDRRGVDEPPSVRIVDVDDSDHGATGLEQQRLGPEVLLDRAVQVEVVAPEVGEHGGVEPGAVDAVQGEGVRRHLHHHRALALVAELGEAGLQLGRLRRRERARQRPDDARRVTGGAQDRARGACSSSSCRWSR